MHLERDRRLNRSAARLLAVAALVLAPSACGGGGTGGTSSPEGESTPTPIPAPTAAQTPAPSADPTPAPGPTEPLEILRLGEGFFGFSGTSLGIPIRLSRDGDVVAHSQEHGRSFTYEDPRFPGLIREGVVYCTRASMWRGSAPATPVDPDPGCPFPEQGESPGGSSWVAALSDDGSVALVDRVVPQSIDAVQNFGFAGDDGSWEEVLFDVDHPDAPRRPHSRGNDLSGDGTLVAGTAWLEYPYPFWGPSDSRAFLYRRGDSSPTWLPTSRDHRIESADFLSADGSVIIGCCEDVDDDSSRSLPVVWYGGGPPSTLDPPSGAATRCRVNDLSADGRVAVGACGLTAVRWVDGRPIAIDVAAPPRPNDVLSSQAFATSEDGSVILGYSNAPDLAGGWIWTEAAGIRPVFELLEEAGIEVDAGTLGGRRLYAVSAMARDGKILAGSGEQGIGDSHFPFLFRATLP